VQKLHEQQSLAHAYISARQQCVIIDP